MDNIKIVLEDIEENSYIISLLGRFATVERIEDKTTNKNNYYDRIRKLTKRVTSDHSIGRWQCLAEYYERYVMN